MSIRGRLRWWGLGLGAVGGVLDTALFLSFGIDFTVAGRDMTGWVAGYLAVSFAGVLYAVGYLVDARAQAKRDAETIAVQMRSLAASERHARQNEKLAAIGHLAAGVAHEVRNPLGVIRASASLVQESFDRDDEAFRACEFICAEIDRLNGLITSLLTFARPSEPRLQRVALEKVVDRALQLAADALSKRGIEVAQRNDGCAPEVSADPDLLAQVVLGLVTNAGEAMETGGRIEVRVAADPEAACIEVADSGPGIPFEDAERVFEPFFTTKATGTGLGLAMSARIVQAHEGHIEVVQERGAGVGGSGACFRVRIPLGGAEREAAT